MGTGSVAALRSRKGFVLFWATLFILSIALQYVAAMAPRTALAADAPVVTLEDGTNGCQGVLPTPGSENTNKRLIGGSLVPGGTATFEISFPVDPEDVAGRTTFVITDCVFIDGKAALKYSVSFVPNTENFILTFTLQIPPGTPLGAEYCNFAKTTAAPSNSQASNRKAGPACFIVGGNITVHKVNEDGDPLAGAKFHIKCTLPTSEASMPDTIINGVSFTSTSGKVIETDVTTGNDGLVTIQAPEGTSCVITETDPPAGYDLPADPSVTLVASADGVSHTFVDPPEFVPAPGLSITKGVSLSASGPFVDSLTTTLGTTVHYRIVITNTGNVELTDVTLNDDLFATAVAACGAPTTLAVGASFTCDYTDTASVGTKTNTATADSAETEPVDDSATVKVEAAPSMTIDKSVSLAADGPFVDSLAVQVGTQVFYRIVITNTGNVELTGLSLEDDVFDLTGTTCDTNLPTSLAVGASFTCGYSDTAVEGTTHNTATADSVQTPPVDDDATVVASPAPVLLVDKTNNAPIVGGLPTVKEGDTVTFKLAYSSNGQTAHNATIKDVLPNGLTYVAGSATSDSQFTFQGFDAGTRTLTWTAAEVDASGSVTYQAKVNTGAAGLQQPLHNVAVIDSDDTEPDSDGSDVFVAPPPQAETAPPTDVAGTEGSSAPGGSMLLVLMALAAIAVAVVFVTPAGTLKRVRERSRRR
jgi:fimbrial isopeptide formation D2 family protein